MRRGTRQHQDRQRQVRRMCDVFKTPCCCLCCCCCFCCCCVCCCCCCCCRCAAAAAAVVAASAAVVAAVAAAQLRAGVFLFGRSFGIGTPVASFASRSDADFAGSMSSSVRRCLETCGRGDHSVGASPARSSARDYVRGFQNPLARCLSRSSCRHSPCKGASPCKPV